VQPGVKVVRERRRVAAGIVEDEHPNAPRLAIPHGREPNLSGPCSCVTQRPGDRVELARRPLSEKRERDMQVTARDDPHTPQLGLLPRLDLVEGIAGEAQREEKAEPFIPAHASG
jgi:hypothetical protein